MKFIRLLIVLCMFLMVSNVVYGEEWHVNNGNLYVNTAKVGIGTTTPQAKLEISANNGYEIKFVDDVANIYGERTMYLLSDEELHFGAGHTNSQMVLKSSGNLGLGSQNPQARLEISANNGYEIKFVDDVANIYGERTMYLLSDEELHFGSGGTNDKMILHSDGSLSVGTQSSGGYKLAVDGTIGARELVVTQDTWSDFVFEDEFKLKSLEEVEKFIKNKKHLPDIPSEKDVLAKGVSVGEMQKLLLQKIEELTLYVIDLKKQNTEQDKLIADLRNIVQ